MIHLKRLLAEITMGSIAPYATQFVWRDVDASSDYIKRYITEEQKISHFNIKNRVKSITETFILFLLF